MTVSLRAIESQGVKNPPLSAPDLRRKMGIQQALEWAFGREKAQLDLDVVDPENNRGAAVSLEWIIAQRAILGCSIDGSTGGGWGGSATARDAELIADFVANLSDEQGGRRMATVIAAHAAGGTVPNWMPDAQPKFIPCEVNQNRYGWSAATADSARLGGQGWRHHTRRNKRGATVVEPVLFCPVMLTPSPGQIHAARGMYLDWWSALLHLSAAIRGWDVLSNIEVTNVMPPMTPWRVS